MNAQSHSIVRRTLVFVVLPLLVLCLVYLALNQLQQPAYSLGLTSPLEEERFDVSATATPPRTPCPSAPSPTPQPPGEKVEIVDEDEIGFVYRYQDSGYLRHKTVDLTGQALAEVAFKRYDSLDALTSVGWIAFTAADVNGTGTKELVSAFQDKNKRLGVITNGAANYEWYHDDAAWKGDNVDWIDITAGNLDRAGEDDEVVVAFADNNNDIRLATLDGDSAGNISNTTSHPAGYYSDSASGRGDVDAVAVDAGDINGDGFDDEIVTVFQDSNNDLQALILRRDATATNSMRLLWSKAWTDNSRGDVASDASGAWRNKRPIDVTLGDLDGDMREEAVLAFRVGNSKDGGLQLLILKFKSQSTDHKTLDMDYSVWMSYSLPDKYHQAGTSVSVSAADLDGDGLDEIAFGFNTTYEDLCSSQGGSYVCNIRWQQHLVTYDYVPFAAPEHTSWCGASSITACLHRRSGAWEGAVDYVSMGDDTDGQNLVLVATGDMDKDGYAEIVLAHGVDATGFADLVAFNADGSLAIIATFGGASAAGNISNDFWLTMGDTNGDSQYATYTDVCYRKTEAQIVSAIYAPPHWPEGHVANNSHHTGASFGIEALKEEGNSSEASTKIGSSVTVGPSLEDIGASFTYGWEYEASTENTQTKSTSDGVEYSTCPAFPCEDEPNYSGIQFVETIYNCFVYYEAQTGNMDVCLPAHSTELRYPQPWWYTTGYDTYHDSWIPVGHNLAQGRYAVQSTVDSGWPAEPSRAVDGNVNGVYTGGSVAHTGSGGAPPATSWWQVDLGGAQWLGAVQVWNRTDAGYTNRLKDFYVFVSEEPFTSNDVNVLKVDPNVWNHLVTGEAGRPTVVPVDHHGRYVRVQLTAAGYLDMAELQVYGMPAAVDQWPKAQPTSLSSSQFQLTWPDPHATGGQVVQTVPGQLLAYEPGPNYSGVRAETLSFKSSLGFGEAGETISSGTTSYETTLGMEIKWFGAEVTTGTSEKTSHILSWGNEVGFYGEVPGLPTGTSSAYNYEVAQYAWLQRATSIGGTNHAFMVGGYWVPLIGPFAGANAAQAVEATRSTLVITPAVPLISSPTHPDPSTWVSSNTASFNWTQPPGDPATIAGYHWYLNQIADTIPYESNFGPTTTETYEQLADGVWHLHVRAVSSGGQWSDTAHRAIRVDANPPQVQLAVDPSSSSGDNGWYVTPVTVTVSASDGDGSGVGNLEFSTDGASWQPYSTPLAFSADTTGTTVYARATDAAGHVSEPVSTTLKIDQTPPNSHVTGGQGPGAWVAGVFTNTLGNQTLALAGAMTDDGSGWAGMSLEYDGLDWTGATAAGSWYPFPSQPEIEVNWYFTATHEIGAGNHILLGRAQDEAGNQEEPYEIARVLWYPLASPDIAGSSLTASPATIRPGDVVTFTVVARNAGWQEAHVSVVDTLPTGLTPVIETLAPDVGYNPAMGSLTWPARLLWPGQWVRHTFQARAATGLPATTLKNQAILHAFWPNTNLLPPAQKQEFLDHEQTVTVTASVAVNPTLPAGVDVTAPWATLVHPSRQVLGIPQVALSLLAAPDARWMFLREWTPDPTGGDWTVAQSSGWIDYTETYTWTLSAGQGVRYLGVWIADGSGNVSTLDEHALVFVNRVDDNQVLADGQRIQYRGDIEQGTWITGLLTTVAGDPDLYAWRPRNGFWPDRYTDATVPPGGVEDLGYQLVQQSGRYLLEVQAVGDSEYRLELAGQAPGMAEESRALAVKPRPQHPLVVSDPLSAGQLGPIAGPLLKIYLPVINRTN